MNITPKAGPSLAMTTATAPSPTQLAARDRAIKVLSQGTPTPPSMPTARVTNSQAHPVSNPNQISPEELSAVNSQVPETEEEKAERLQTQGQNTNSEESNTPAEAPKEAKPEALAEESKNPLSSQYAILARKEQAYRAKIAQQNASIRAREEVILQREAAIKAKEAEYATSYIPKDRLTKDPFGVLNEAGINYDQLTERMLNPPAKLDPSTEAYIKSLETKINAIAENQEKATKSQQEQQTQAYQQAVHQLRADTRALVSSDPAFEMIRETSSTNDVVQLIEQTFKKDGILLSVDDACKEVEEYLADEAIRLARLKKVQDRMKVGQAPAAQSTSKPLNQQQHMTTLSNRTTSNKPMSARERAIAAFNARKQTGG